ncbi:uncharacterized protein LOC131651659 [Vicia villosa]|uniref:uncharacterized protein LOC131651659 n=1 Tax=Vicia villosa TaxID=3911 RepID=UPI00273C13E3|nr:uncharacterized protein LOC131651659 [Vicia villosa]
MKPPSQPVKTKGAPKKVKSKPNDNSITRSPSYCEHVDKCFPDSPTPKLKKSQKCSNKGPRLRKPPPTPIPPQVPHVSTPILTPIVPKVQNPTPIAPSIEEIVNVVGDGSCGFRALSAMLGKGEDAHELLLHDLTDELVNHKDSYTRVFGDETKFQSVNEALVPWGDAYAPISHWMRFPEMEHLIACAYDMVCIDLTRYGFSETFFPLRTSYKSN